MTLNVWGLTWPAARDTPLRLHAVGDALERLRCDLIAFQEVWTEEAVRTLSEAGQRSGWSHAWREPSGGGLLVLSRSPLLHTRFEPYITQGLPERVAHMDYWGRKGFIELQLATGRGVVTLFNTHLHAQYQVDAYPEYRAHRMGQVVQLAARVRAVAGPVVAVGDFNFREGDPDYAAWLGLTGMRDAAATLDARQPTIIASGPYGAGSEDARIDYVFGRRGIETDLRPERIQRVFDREWLVDGRPTTYSDHAGLWSELEIRPLEASEPLPPPDPAALELAAQQLGRGRALARSRRRTQRATVGAGLLGGWLTIKGRRAPWIARRRLLRGMLGGAALLAVPAAGAIAALSELAVPDELARFERVEQILAGIRTSSLPG